jgi:hypothetical protein
MDLPISTSIGIDISNANANINFIEDKQLIRRFPEILGGIIIMLAKIFGKTSIREIGFREIVGKG